MRKKRGDDVRPLVIIMPLLLWSFVIIVISLFSRLLSHLFLLSSANNGPNGTPPLFLLHTLPTGESPHLFVHL
jgi:hypothetical protein